MTPFPQLDWPQSASVLLDQAKQGGDLVKLIMAGTHHIESWLIENRVLPLLGTHQLGVMRFEVSHGQEVRTASLAPLPDGTAFACNTDGLWSAMLSEEALLEIQHIGARFAPGDHWQRGFSAHYRQAAGDNAPLTPLALADLWEQTTGKRPSGFAVGRLDEMEAFGLGIAEKLLHTKSRLGL